ncbi:MAG: prolyl oligopeptidase family serine peptidase [Planctomycetota bacterium]
MRTDLCLTLFRFSTRSIATWCLLLLATLSFAQHAQAQTDKRELDHSDYDLWNSIGSTQLSNDGKWAAFSISSAKKDSESTLYVRNTGSTKQYVIPRAASARFTYDAKHIAYRVTPEKKRIEELKKAKLKSDELPTGKLEILHLATGQRSTFDRVSSFSVPQKNGRWVAFLDQDGADKKLTQATSKVNESLEVTPAGLKERSKKQKLKPRREDPTKMPEPKSGEAKKTTKKPAKPQPDEKKTDDVKPEVKKKSIGKTLVLRDLETGLQKTYPYVVRFSFDKHGTRLAFVTSVIDDSSKVKKQDDKTKENTDDSQAITDGIHVVDLAKMELHTILSGMGEYSGVRFNEAGDQLAFLSNKDDYLVKSPSWSIYHWKAGKKEATQVATESSAGIPEGWWISPNASISFSEDDKRFYFNTAPVPEKVAKERKEAANRKAGKESEKEEAKAKLDLWHWQDPRLQPQQLLQAASDRNRSYRAAMDLKTKKIVQLATKLVPFLRIDTRSPSSMVVASTDVPYRKMMSWDIPGFRDTYLVDLTTGDREVIIKKSKAAGSLSPNGKFVTWFDAEQKKWYAISTGKNREPVEISKGIQHPLFNVLHDTPSLPPSYGSAGWLDDDAGFLIYDRYDLWQLDPTGNEPPICLTEGFGRENKIRFRAQRLDREARSFNPEEPIYMTAFDDTSKSSGFYRLNLNDETENVGKTSNDKKKSDQAKSKSKESNDSKVAKLNQRGLHKLMMVDENIGRLSKAENDDQVMFTRSTFEMSPDLWTSTLDFKKVSRLSDANPQQKDYLWGSAELVHWDAADGQKLDGLLYKPEGFDPNKKYPLMVYFYERNSDNLHRYYAPAAGRSIINFSFYVSRGYVIFVPDIPYRTGEPGPSAANAILPGVEHLIEKGFVDKDKIGMQGHSWGGYQTAYLVTQTDMFACAESGAPVSNMTSAYGGIRWGSGMSRMFQYERTQSRIGDDLWSARDKYIANSPVFFADKVNTPLLILHNDEDGAVPWYQGIELFVALRRLEKPAWLLNYNGDPHWVMGDANRIDFAKRMQQFFDHYLKDQPEPEWMAYGIPAVDKGKEFGFDLLEPPKMENEEVEEKTETENEE